MFILYRNIIIGLLSLFFFVIPLTKGSANVLEGGGAVYNSTAEFFDEKEYSGAITADGYISKNNNIQVLNETEVTPASFGKYNDNNTYTFTADSVLTSVAGEKFPKSLWTAILKNKETAIIKEFEALGKKDFESLQFSGDLDTSRGYNFWVDNFEATVKAAQASKDPKLRYVYFRLSTGAQNYYIKVDSYNQPQITRTSKAIKEYKDAVKSGLLAGSIKASYNVATIYADKLTNLKDVVERKDGKTTLKTNANVKYTAQYFLNPFFGKMKYEDVMGKDKNTSNHAFWKKYLNSIKMIHVDGNKLMFVLNDVYYTFLTERGNDPFLTSLSNVSALNAKGLTSYTSSNGAKSVPSSLADSSLYLMSIETLSKQPDSNKYLFKADGLKLYTQYKYSLNTGMIYKATTNGNYVPAFTLGDLGLKETDIQLYYKKNNDVTYGGLFPLKYNEVIYNPNTNTMYDTGRVLRFSGAYSTNLSFTDKNTGIMSVTGTGGSQVAVSLSEYSFSDNGSYEEMDSHIKLVNPNNVKLETTVIEPNAKGEPGISMVRNNSYVDDPELKKWLESDEAKAKANVEEDELLGLITGKIDLEKEDVTFDDYMRMQEINEELEGSWRDKIIKVIVLVSGTLGWMIFIYSFLLLSAFLFDRINPIFNKSVFTLLTANKMVGVGDKYEMELAMATGEDKIYVGWVRLAFIIVLLLFLALLLVVFNPIVTVILWLWDLYYKLTGGGIV